MSLLELEVSVFKLGNAPTSWGVEKEIVTTRPSWESFLDDVRDCGYLGTELGPLGFLPTDPGELSAALKERGLSLTAGYVMGPLHTEEGAAELLGEARETVPLIAEAGAEHLVVIGGIPPERAATAGRSQAAPRLSADAFERQLETIAEIAALAARSGIKAGVHPHAGSYIEFADEVERVLKATDPGLVGLVLDTGHALYGGIEPAEAIRNFADRLTYVHLKDVHPTVLARARHEELGFWDAYRAGVFCVLGTGANDFGLIRAALEDVGYDGWLTVEQDADPSGASDPRRDAVASLVFLRSAGLAA